MFRKWPLKKFLVVIAKVTGYVIVSVIVLLVLLASIIQLPSVQNRITQKAVAFLQKKIGTKVSLGHFSLSFPKKLVLEEIYFEDEKSDTLLYAGKLSIDTDLWALAHHKIELNDIALEDSHAFISRSEKDGIFNFDYIINAFNTPSTAAPDTTSSPWEFDIGDVQLTNIHLIYNDSTAGIDARVQLSKLIVEVEKLDLTHDALKIKTTELADARASIVQWQPAERAHQTNAPPSTADSTSFDLEIDEINARDVAADYYQKTDGLHARINLGELQIAINELNLPGKVIDVDQIKLAGTFLSYQQSARTEERKDLPGASHSQVTQDSQKPGQSPWKITLKQLNLDDNNVQYYDFNNPTQARGIDYSHLWLSHLSVKASDLSMNGNVMRGSINTLALIDKSGFQVTDLKGSVDISETKAVVSNFQFDSPNSHIVMSANSAFASLARLNEAYDDAAIEVTIDRSSIGLSDVLYFVPDLLDSVPVTLASTSTVVLDAKMKGKVKDLSIHHLKVQLLGQTTVALSGKIVGLPGDDPVLNIALQKFYTTDKDVNSLLPDSVLPKTINIPTWVEMHGNLKGSLKSPKVTAVLTSSDGGINIDGRLKQSGKSRPTYDGKLTIRDLALGKILQQPEDIGMLSMNAQVHGAGFTMEELDTRVDMIVNSFEYKQYRYRNFKLNGKFKGYLFTGKATLSDENLDFVLEGDMDYNKDVPLYKFKFNLKNANFKALQLSERPLKARGIIDVNLATSDFAVINGNLDIRHVAIYNGDALYSVDSLLFASIDQEGQSKITIRSDIVSGDFEGTINLASMPQAVKRHFNEYFSLRDSVFDKPVGPQNFSFSLVLKNTELLTEIILPDLDPFVPGKIEGEFDSEKNLLRLQAEVSHIRYAGVGLDSLSLNVFSDKNSLDYTISLRKILVDTLRIEALRLTGKVANDSIRTRLIVLDSLLKQKYVLGGAFYSQEKAIQFRFLPDETILHYAPWETPSDNYLRFTSEGILAHNFSITNINEKISFITQEEKDARTAIVFKDLNIQNLTNLVEGTILADGLINGDFIVSGKGTFRSSLKIQKLKIFDQLWGDLSLNLNHGADSSYLVDLGLHGDNVEFSAKGKYAADANGSEIDLFTDIARINLSVVEPFSGGQLKNSSGILTGEVTIKGQLTSPKIDGFVAFEDATITPSFANSKFILKDEKISFTPEGIILENFRLLDEQNNVAVLKGKIRTKTYSDFDLDLTFAAKNFQLLNTEEDDNDLFYGKIGMNVNAIIAGTFIQPKVEMDVSLNDESNLTYIVPQSEKGVLEQKGIVIFVDNDAKKDPFLKGIDPRDTVKSKFTGLNLTANIQLDDKETLSIIIDPVTGDKLTVKGNSTLTLDIDPSGDVQLSGRYEITEGSYDLTFYKLVKRKFAIEKGSSITWAGDPLDATMDIRASFRVETSPLELVAGQYDTNDPSLNMYRQRFPFLVYLNIDGHLLTPEISFELDMPVEKRDPAVYAKIKDINTRESDLNKQVFALLILKRFVSDNIFDSQGSDVESTARRSVSRLLTEQLNRMSENIKGIELSFDVKSYDDYSSGEAQGQTQVQLGVSKSLLDNRLIVKVSGNVDVEGEASSQNSFTDYIGDLALEYKLTEDGRFRITGFRNSNYDIISGELIETGAGLIYIKDYNTLRELFKDNAKEK